METQLVRLDAQKRRSHSIMCIHSAIAGTAEPSSPYSNLKEKPILASIKSL